MRSHEMSVWGKVLFYPVQHHYIDYRNFGWVILMALRRSIRFEVKTRNKTKQKWQMCSVFDAMNTSMLHVTVCRFTKDVPQIEKSVELNLKPISLSIMKNAGNEHCTSSSRHPHERWMNFQEHGAGEEKRRRKKVHKKKPGYASRLFTLFIAYTYTRVTVRTYRLNFLKLWNDIPLQRLLALFRFELSLISTSDFSARVSIALVQRAESA